MSGKRQCLGQWSPVTAVRWLVAAVALLILCWGLLPIAFGVVNAGVITAGIVGGGLLLVAVGWPRWRLWWRYRVGRVVMSIVLIVAVVGIVLFVIASLCMLHAAAKTPQNADTVIVLGAGLQGDQPSRTLAARLDAAAQYLQAHPTAVCIVTGGQGNNEAYTEASVMYTYLVSKGIDPSRLYREEKSTNTKENLSFAAAVIDSEGLDRRVVIATQEFHQYRAQALANQAGLEVAGPLTCRSETALLFCYWIREFAAIGRLWLLG